MQLIKLTTFAAFIMAVSATVPGVLNIRGEADDLADLVARGGSCSNDGLIKSQKYAKEGCVPEKSKGKRSSHNCAENVGGTAYLCVQSGQSFCLSGKSKLRNAGLENGECFL